MLDISKLYVFGISFFFSCFFAGFVRPIEPDGRIVNGDIQVTATSYVVSITQDGTHFCGGFIFNKKFVITTAYCVQNKTVNNMRVVINQASLIDQDPYEEEIPVFKVNIKDDFNSANFVNDIAIIQLSKELSLIPYNSLSSTNPGPSCVRYDEVLPSQQAIDGALIYGWGATEFEGLGAQKLRRGLVNITSNQDCIERYGPDQFQASAMICGANLELKGLKTGPCHYDEGAPLVVSDTKVFDLVVVGIYSKNQNCSVDVPSVYTRLSTHYAWINQVAGAQPNDCYFPAHTTPAPGPAT